LHTIGITNATRELCRFTKRSPCTRRLSGLRIAIADTHERAWRWLYAMTCFELGARLVIFANIEKRESLLEETIRFVRRRRGDRGP
jgi:hypothetical protein